jgi:hypothetical protein
MKVKYSANSHRTVVTPPNRPPAQRRAAHECRLHDQVQPECPSPMTHVAIVTPTGDSLPP